MSGTSRDLVPARLKENGLAGLRVEKAMEWELRDWSIEEIDLLLHRLRPLGSEKGSNAPCGPRYNLLSSFSVEFMLTTASVALRLFAISLTFPFQLGTAFYLAFKRRWKAIWTDVPQPTFVIWRSLATAPDPSIKTPRALIQSSIDESKALCVNRQGSIRLMSGGYTVMSHAWQETMAWQSPTEWGPVSLELRKKGFSLGHLQRCIDQCETEWLWLDQIAMPEVFEDMDAAQRSQTEQLRIDIINNLHTIYTRAEKVVIVDSALMRLNTSSLVDAAVVLSLGYWMTRLWPMTECWLASKVLLKTEDQSFDLDVIIDYLARTINNDQHRYFPLLSRLTPLRPTPPWSERLIIYGDSKNPESQTFNDICRASETRYTNVEIDVAMVLFPLLNLKWEYEWTLEDGLHHIERRYPDHVHLLGQYTKYTKVGSSL